MPRPVTTRWKGASGKNYQYFVYSVGEFPSEQRGGNYVFARLSSNGNWIALYIGQAENLHERVTRHEIWPCVKRHGVTHIHAHLNALQQDRMEEEADLLEGRDPPCNRR